MMASGDPKWDLSPNDVTALKGVIAELRAARECVSELESLQGEHLYGGYPIESPSLLKYREATKGDG